MAQFDKFDVMAATVGTALATNGTVTFTYPTKSPARAAASYNPAATGAVLAASQGFEGLFKQGASNFSLAYGATTVVMTYLGATTIPVGVTLTLQCPVGAYDNLTDNTTGTATSTMAAGAGVLTVSIPVDLTQFTVGAIDVVTTYVPGYKFALLDMQFVVNKPGTGAGATQAINPKITGVAVTGGVATPTLANTAAMGAKVAGTAITALNTGAVTDSISVSAAAGGVVFTAGSGVILLKIQNMDTADAIASLAAKLASANAILNAREIYPQAIAN